MMIVELIDQTDFRERLSALGIEIHAQASPECAARLAARCHRARGVEGLEALVRELMGKRDILLPSVHEAIRTHLLPALEVSPEHG
ncbi:hypothetical protein C7446_0550 [Kushneria sinocarnis]|uniref:Uncharacterized protein n=1 Tax=Kushneria sinocarnis TaxID=595502 RepID=A0A420WZA9_9GAMM|nr:hypothetical protein [Kushneria sinocarnis]RKR06569.1 hypothetical protein C7446_0550 [Kushneria sinocarnis]